MDKKSIRQIIHLDLDAFFCAVEEKRDPSLVGKPFAVGGKPDQRGVVASCSYAARISGVHSAMPMAKAIRICSDLIIVSSHYQTYSLASKQVMERLREVTPWVEQISIDEAFLDVTDSSESAEILGKHLQDRIHNDLNLPCSLGLATNKLIAKIANDVGKSSSVGCNPPRAFTVVPPGEEAEFLAPLPAKMLWGIGPKTAARLAEIGIHTIGDLARVPTADLNNRFGKHGWEMSRRAKGIDERPIVTSYSPKSFSNETTYPRDTAIETDLKHTLSKLSLRVTKQLKKARLYGSTIKIKLRWSDFTTITRQITLSNPTDDSAIICLSAEQLFDKTWQPGRPVRLLGVGISNLADKTHQPGLWDSSAVKEQRLFDILDDIHERFGNHAIQRGLSEISAQEE
jgi:DNA polymerase IV